MDYDEKIKLRVISLLVSKQLVTSALIVLIGGVASLFLMDGHNTPRIFLAMLGIFYIAILGKELYKVGKELRKYLYDNKGDEK